MFNSQIYHNDLILIDRDFITDCRSEWSELKAIFFTFRVDRCLLPFNIMQVHTMAGPHSEIITGTCQLWVTGTVHSKDPEPITSHVDDGLLSLI